MDDLARRRCVPCKGGETPLRGEALRALAAKLDGAWEIIDEHHLTREFRFPDFVRALAFTNRVAEVAEAEQHHPDIHLAWGKVGVTIWTHAIDGLSESDFILAAKIDRLV